MSDIDGATGRVTIDPERVYTRKDQMLTVCPGMNGGKNWPAGAYSPRTRAMYMPMQNLCMNAKTQHGRARSVARLRPRSGADPGARRRQDGRIWAVSAETGETLWRHEQRAGVMAMVATGGGLVFGGDVAGRFTAYDDATGEVLWQADLGSPISGFPGDVRRRRQAVRRGQHGPVQRAAQRFESHAGDRARGAREPAVRVRAAVARMWRVRRGSRA